MGVGLAEAVGTTVGPVVDVGRVVAVGLGVGVGVGFGAPVTVKGAEAIPSPRPICTVTL